MTIVLFQAVLLFATLLCSLVAGFLFAFAVVVMPSIGRLDDGGFIRAFQVVDGVIQDNQPLFLLVWVGSVLALIAAAVLGLWALAGADRLLLIGTALIYVAGVQLTTGRINIPLNNALQKVRPDTMDDATRKAARQGFEERWNRSNVFRAACAALVSLLLMFLLIRM